MWGNIVLESNFFKVYNFGFLSNSSDILISLIHWQYWWWFWFSFLLCFYYVLLIKCISSHSLKFYPKIVNSFRSHGKWGDVIVCLLPVSWCINILSNSTTLLKLIEWQSEASVLTLRVRGKQWYWVYKVDINSMANCLKTSILSYKIGHFNVNIDTNTFSPNKAIFYKNNTGTVNPVNINNFTKLINHSSYKNTFISNSLFSSIECFSSEVLYNYKNILLSSIDILNIDKLSYFNTGSQISLVSRDLITQDLIFFSKDNYKLNFFKFNAKKINYTKYITTVQKRIDDWVKISSSSIKENNLTINNFLNFDNYINYKNYNNNRLLNINKILVLPTNIFINVITNSFDVIHSWFIPGLGFKMDCIPGRSTHHTLYIDLPGIYYGQCAEICGRFHHHMPIKICSLYIDHYIMYSINFNTKLYKYANI